VIRARGAAGRLPARQSLLCGDKSVWLALAWLALWLRVADQMVGKVIESDQLPSPKPPKIFDKFKSAHITHCCRFGFPSLAPALI
jgi:hypothetical protein